MHNLRQEFGVSGVWGLTCGSVGSSSLRFPLLGFPMQDSSDFKFSPAPSTLARGDRPPCRALHPPPRTESECLDWLFRRGSGDPKHRPISNLSCRGDGVHPPML